MRLSDLTIKDLHSLESVGANLHLTRSLSRKPRLVLSNLSDARNNIDLLPSHLQKFVAYYINKEVITLIGDPRHDTH